MKLYNLKPIIPNDTRCKTGGCCVSAENEEEARDLASALLGDKYKRKDEIWKDKSVVSCEVISERNDNAIQQSVEKLVSSTEKEALEKSWKAYSHLFDDEEVPAQIKPTTLTKHASLLAPLGTAVGLLFGVYILADTIVAYRHHAVSYQHMFVLAGGGFLCLLLLYVAIICLYEALTIFLNRKE